MDVVLFFFFFWGHGNLPNANEVACLVDKLKLTFLVFKQFYTLFYIFFQPHVFQKITNNITQNQTGRSLSSRSTFRDVWYSHANELLAQTNVLFSFEGISFISFFPFYIFRDKYVRNVYPSYKFKNFNEKFVSQLYFCFCSPY